MKNVNKWMLFVRVVIVLAFIYLVLTAFEWSYFEEAGLELLHNPLIIIAIFFCYFLSFYLKAIVWKLYFNGKISISSGLFGIFYSLLVNHLVPLKVGDIVRAMVFSNREKEVTLEQSFHSVFILRLMDIASLMLLTGIGLLFLQTTFTFPILIFSVLSMVGVMIAFVIKTRFPVFFNRNWQFFCQAFAHWNGLRMFLLIIISWILESAVVFGVAYALADPVSISDAIWVTSVTIIGQIFQFTPGGITTYEAVMTYALNVVNISLEKGIMIAIYSHALKFIFSYVVGIIIYLLYPITLGTMKSWFRLKGVKRIEKRV